MQRKIVKVRFETSTEEATWFRDLIWDGRKILYEEGIAAHDTVERRRPQIGLRFPDEAAAEKSFELQLPRNKTMRSGQPWQKQTRSETLVDGPDATGLQAGAEHPALERQILDGDLRAAQVYADWLQSQGDLRGSLAMTPEAEAETWLEAHDEALLGELDVLLGTVITGLTWKHGFLDGVLITRMLQGTRVYDLAQITAEFLELPLARLLSALAVHTGPQYSPNNDWTATVAAIATSPRAAQLRSLSFNPIGHSRTEWSGTGDFSTLWRAAPALEYVHIRAGAITLGDIDGPALRTFWRETVSAADLPVMRAARWPKLEALNLGLATPGDSEPLSLERFAFVFDGKLPATLTHLGLLDSPIPGELWRTLARSKVLPRLKTLTLTGDELTDQIVDKLVAHAPAFRHLHRIDLSRHSFEDRATEVAAALPNADLGDYELEQDDQ